MMVVQVVAMILQILLVLMFLMSGSGKIAGNKMSAEVFEHLKLPQWFRFFTGLVEVIGAAVLIVGFWQPSWIAVGALWFGIISLGGILAHIRVKDTFKQTSMITLLFIISVALFII
jgi:putative oxidoreductase